MKSATRAWVLGLLFVGALLLLALYPLLSRGEEWLAADWQQPWFLLGLAALPLVLGFSTLGRDARVPRLRLGTVAAFGSGPRGVRVWFRDLPGVLRTVGLAGMVLALARPVNTLRPAESEEEGIDIVVALDLSGSMAASISNLPNNLVPYMPERPRGVLPTRVDVARAVLRDFIARRKTDRIGVVVFAADAFVLSPPTLDYHLLDSLVAKMDLNLISADGTAIGDALGVSVARLRRSTATTKVVLLLTDGDNKGGKLAPEFGADLAKQVGVKVFTIQIGQGDMAQFQKGFDLFGQPQYVNVPAPTNPSLLRDLAKRTGGQAYVASDAKGLQDSVHEVLNTLERTKFDSNTASYEELYRYLLLPSVVLIALEALLSAIWLRRFP